MSTIRINPQFSGQLPISRKTGRDRSSTNLGGKPVYQDLELISRYLVSKSCSPDRSIGQQPVYFELAQHRRVIPACSNIDLAVRYSRKCELDCMPGLIRSRLRAVPYFFRKVRGVVGMQNGRATTGRLRCAILAVVERPHDPIERSSRRKGRRCPWEPV